MTLMPSPNTPEKCCDSTEPHDHLGMSSMEVVEPKSAGQETGEWLRIYRENVEPALRSDSPSWADIVENTIKEARESGIKEAIEIAKERLESSKDNELAEREELAFQDGRRAAYELTLDRLQSLLTNKE